MRARRRSTWRMGPWLCVVVTVALLLVAVPPRRAEASTGLSAVGLGEAILLMMFGEVLIPDTFVEIDGATGVVSADLGWPVPVTLLHVDLSVVTTVLHVSLEPRLNTRCGDARGVFAGRLSLLPTPLEGFGVYGEGGYVVGTDGNGALAGGGLEYELEPGVASILLMYRATLLEDTTRHTTGLNFELALPAHLLFN